MLKKIDLARTHKVTPSFVTRLIQGDKFTTIPGLALAAAQMTGKKPILFFNPRLRDLALAAHPELAKIPKKSA